MPRLPKDKFGSITFVVRGRGEFPIDMLRYDSCVPATEKDVMRMLNTLYGSDVYVEGPINRDVKLRRFYPVGGTAAPTVARWVSFGWEVREVYP